MHTSSETRPILLPRDTLDYFGCRPLATQFALPPYWIQNGSRYEYDALTYCTTVVQNTERTVFRISCRTDSAAPDGILALLRRISKHAN